MTKEEAAKIIRNYTALPCGYCHEGGEEVAEAFRIAIEALDPNLIDKEMRDTET